MVKADSSVQTASMEDYLEAIAVLTEEANPVTVTAISKTLGVTKPSVDWALGKLSEAGLVEHERYGDVQLTAKGARLAQDVYRRHRTLHQFLVDILDVDPEIAEQDACRIEHVISSVTMERLSRFLDFVINCPQGKSKLIEGLEYYLAHGKRDEKIVAQCRRESKED
jgi:DtxR family Mn-dependent transcriptional regulator